VLSRTEINACYDDNIGGRLIVRVYFERPSARRRRRRRRRDPLKSVSDITSPRTIFIYRGDGVRVVCVLCARARLPIVPAAPFFSFPNTSRRTNK